MECRYGASSPGVSVSHRKLLRVVADQAPLGPGNADVEQHRLDEVAIPHHLLVGVAG